jgi:hypothetical protein
VQFNHDLFIFGLIRTIMGHEGFKVIFKPHIIIPFMSTIRFRVRDEVVRMFLNDRELNLNDCYEAGETTCKLSNFIRMIDISNF